MGASTNDISTLASSLVGSSALGANPLATAQLLSSTGIVNCQCKIIFFTIGVFKKILGISHFNSCRDVYCVACFVSVNSVMLKE